MTNQYNGNDLIVHIYKIRIGGDYYKVIACGNKYLIEKYLKKELIVDEIEWERSKLSDGRVISSFCKGNRIIARDSFLIKLEFAYQLGTRRAKPMPDILNQQWKEVIWIVDKQVNVDIDARLLDYREDRKQLQLKLKVANDYATQITEKCYGSDPETLMIEDERRDVVEFLETEFLSKLLTELNPQEVAFLYKYIDNDNNALQTAKDLEVSESKIRRVIKHIQEKAKNLLSNMKMVKTEEYRYEQGGVIKTKTITREIPVSYEDAKECFRPTVNLNHTQSAMSVGYPSETYMNLPKGKKWTIKYGSTEFTTTKSCLIPEYLEITNCKCVCNICNENFKCSRKDAFPENEEPAALKANAMKIDECIANLQASYKPEDFIGLDRLTL